MHKYVIGVDPDSKEHGLAFYIDGCLAGLEMVPLMKIIEWVNREKLKGTEMVFSIENVMANQFIYGRNQRDSKAAQSKIAMHVGRCQQAFVELTRALDCLEVPYVLHKPQKGNWAKDKAMFERITKWTGKSNADTRSAAFFGYLGVK